MKIALSIIFPIYLSFLPLSYTYSPPLSVACLQFSECSPGYFGSPPNCVCYEEDTAYFGNNARVGSDNPQPSMAACQKSCAADSSCEFWTWGKGTPTGPCYLKTKRENVTPNLKSYVSGSKNCRLPSEGNSRGDPPACCLPC